MLDTLLYAALTQDLRDYLLNQLFCRVDAVLSSAKESKIFTIHKIFVCLTKNAVTHIETT